MTEISVGLLLRVWEEVFLLFLEYIHNSKKSPFKKMTAIFLRKEYQKNSGDLS